jgi:EAL domain-containing protein (putative c-di-GMP-specific phosphodiesterase class I)
MVKKVLNDVLKYNFNVSINFSFEDIMNENLVKYIKNFLKKHNLGYKITFEIVESEQINENSIIKTFFKDIKKLHCSLSIDDFGSGYSNYDQLLNRNTDYLKIDGSLINKYKEKNYENMIKSIVYFCKKSGIKVVAEFVDNEEKQKFIKKWNIDFSQGYYFSKPISIQEIFGEKK